MSRRFSVQDATGRIANGPDPNNGILSYTRGAPTNSIGGYEPGALNWDLTNTVLYFNAGSKTSSNWVDISTAAQLLPGLLATAAELNRSSQVSTRNVSVAAATTTLSLTLASHEGKTVLVAPTGGLVITPPAATGTGGIYTLAVTATVTGGSLTIDFKAANASDVINGTGYQFKAGTGLVAYSASTNTNLITLNGTTTGGIIGDIVQIQDVATNQWVIRLFSTQATGTVATPFSNH